MMTVHPQKIDLEVFELEEFRLWTHSQGDYLVRDVIQTSEGYALLNVYIGQDDQSPILITSTSDDHDFEVAVITGYQTLMLTREDFARAEVIPATAVHPAIFH
jgi:hypothetical protein